MEDKKDNKNIKLAMVGGKIARKPRPAIAKETKTD